MLSFFLFQNPKLEFARHSLKLGQTLCSVLHLKVGEDFAGHYFLYLIVNHFTSQG